MSKKSGGAAAKKKFPFGRFLLWKTSDISSAGLTIIVTSYLTIYCTNYLGLSGTLVGTILLVSNVIDAVTDLVAGFVIDNTHSKLGKGRPYEIGIVGMWICTWLMFSGPVSAGQAVKVMWVFFMYTFIFGVFNTLRGAGSTAYMIRAFDNDRELIGKVGSYGGIVTTLGSMIVSLSFPVAMGVIATSAAGWSRLVALYAVPLAVIGAGRFVFVKENPSIDDGVKNEPVTLKDFWQVFTKNKYVWFYAGMILIFNTITNMSAQTYYFTYIVGNTDLLGVLSIMGTLLLPVMLFMPLLLKKFSVPKVVMGGAIIAIFGYAINFIAGSSIGLLMTAGVMTACLSLPISYLCAILLMNLFDYNEYKGLARLEGTTNQLAHGISGQLGQGLGGFMLGVFLDISGFITSTDGSAVTQPDSAIFMIRCLYSIIPIILLVILIVCVFFLSRLDKEMPEINRVLNEKRAVIAAEKAAAAQEAQSVQESGEPDSKA